MADNVSTVADANATLPASTAIATDDVGGVHYQRIKLDVGADGAASPVGASGLPVNDAGGSLTVDGTVGVSGSVAVTGTFFQATQPVSAAALPLPTGAATEVESEAITAATLAVGTAVAAVETAIEDLGADADAADIVYLAKLDDIITATEATQAAVQIIDNAISGSEMQVDVVASLPAGTNNIGDVDVASIAAGDNNIGNVDVVTLPALPAGTNNIGDVDVLTLPALPAGTNNIGDVDVVSMPSVTTDTHSNVASSASNVTLLASNASRKGAAIYNDSTAILYVKFGATASATSFKVAMAAASYYEFPQPIYTGIVDGIWASANGNARITES
jgi:hypothetical protein